MAEAYAYGLLAALILMAVYAYRTDRAAKDAQGEARTFEAKFLAEHERHEQSRQRHDLLRCDYQTRERELLRLNKDLHADLQEMRGPSVFDDLHLLDEFCPEWSKIELDPLWTEQLQPWFRRLLYQAMFTASREKDREERDGYLRDVRLLEGIIRQPMDEIRRTAQQKRMQADHMAALGMTEED